MAPASVPPTAAEPALPARRWRTRRVLQAVVSVVIVVAVFAFAVPRFASYGSAWAVLRQLTWTELALLLAVAVFNLVTYWPRAMAALPGLGFWQAAVRYQTTITVTYTVPAGGVLAVACHTRCCAPGASR